MRNSETIQPYLDADSEALNAIGEWFVAYSNGTDYDFAELERRFTLTTVSSCDVYTILMSMADEYDRRTETHKLSLLGVPFYEIAQLNL